MFPRLEFNPGNLYIKNELIGSGIPEISDMSIDEFPGTISFPMSADIELSAECKINHDAVDRLIGLDFAQNCDMSCSIQFSQPYQEQIRRHKKKRINKKWAKRYGFRTKYRKIRIPEVSIVPKLNHDYEYEFVTSGRPEIVKGR
jgi:ribosomal protein L21